ncbi:MAG: hypothetical protein NT178_18750 [Proteobacteria bacterium]|nr:hypothetical protein [Pseudomonadota bacterium]
MRENNAMNEWVSFFEPHFIDSHAAEHFVNRCELLTPSHSNHKAKIMMHQTQRLVSIADDIPILRPRRESLPLLFLMICVEHISKLHDSFADEGQSRKYVRRFFNQFLSQPDKEKLEASFLDYNATPMVGLNLGKVVDLLYDLRCDVVHEGKYWTFFFSDGRTPIVNVDPDVNVYLTLIDLGDIVVRGCINAIEDKLKP